MLQFSNQLKKLWTERGISQEELASQLFISRQAISKWEKGDGKPDLDTVVKLAEIFDVKLRLPHSRQRRSGQPCG